MNTRDQAPGFAAAYQAVLAEAVNDPERFRQLATDFFRYQMLLLERMHG